MLRKFSEELVEDREFEIGGELFKFRYPHWEEGAKLFDEELTPETNGSGPDDPATFSFRADTEFALKRIPMFLDPANDAVKRFGALTKRKVDPVPRYQFVQLYRWLVQVTSGAPYDTALRAAGWGWGQRHIILGRIVLEGGDIDRMSLRSFMYASEVLRLQQQERFHVETAEPVREPTPAEMRERNAQSMQMLQGMMAGVKKR